MNTFDSYDAVGNREDLSNIIFDISPTDTPFLSGIGKNKATAKNHEWLTDSLAAVADNKAIEGDDATGSALAAATRLGNKCQISQKTVVVSGTQQALKPAGRAKEMAYQIAKKGKELKRDMENALVGLNNAAVTGNATTAAELASVLSWINTNTSLGTGGADPTGDGTDARTDGTQRALTEALMTTVMEAIWNAGGDPGVVMVGSHNKKVISGFSGNSTRFDKGEDKKLTASIDIYESDFGTYKIVANRFSRARDCLILDLNHWKISTLRPFKTEKLAKTGDSDKYQLLVEYTLEACNEAASGIVADLTTA